MWRPIREEDLQATLSDKEMKAYEQSVSSGATPIAELLVRTADMVRGYIRAGGRVQTPPQSGTIPEGLISPACDYIAYDLLKRLPVPVMEDRRRAREQAIALFERVASGDFIPETPMDFGTTSDKARPCWMPRRRVLD